MKRLAPTSLTKKIQIMKKSSTFSNLDETVQRELVEMAFERSLKPGEFLFQENERCDNFYLLLEGKLRTFLFSSLGKELTLITCLRPGEILGPTSIFRDRPAAGR
jgi:CRP-like cAMP-binding protein